MSFRPGAAGPQDRGMIFPGVLKMTRVGLGVRIRLLPETCKLMMVYTLEEEAERIWKRWGHSIRRSPERTRETRPGQSRWRS